MVKVEHLTPIPMGRNPYSVDLFRMGCDAGNKLNDERHAFSIMWGLENNKLVVIFNPSGERVELTFEALSNLVKVVEQSNRNQTSIPGKIYQDLME